MQLIARDPSETNLYWTTDALTSTDVDGDGSLDLIVGNYFRDGAPVLDPTSVVPVEMQDSMSRAFNGGRNHFFLGNPSSPHLFEEVDAEFVDSAGEAYLDTDRLLCGWTLAVAAADLDGNALPELFFGNDFGPDRLFANESKQGSIRFRLLEGRPELSMPRSKVLDRDSFKTMGADFAYLQDLFDISIDPEMPSLFTSNIATKWGLMENHGAFIPAIGASIAGTHAPYKDHSEKVGLSRHGWGWDVKADDLDNDGLLEIVRAVNFVRGTVDYWPRLHEIAESNDWWLRNAANWPPMNEKTDISGWDPLPIYALHEGRYILASSSIPVTTGIAPAQHPALVQAALTTSPSPVSGGSLSDHSFVTRGIAVSDVDADGLKDLFLANQWQDSTLLRNVSKLQYRWIGLCLMHPVGGNKVPRPAASFQGVPDTYAQQVKPAIGATVVLEDAEGEELARAQVDGGNGHSGKRSPPLVFALNEQSLGTDAVTLTARIRWREKGKPYETAVQLTGNFEADGGLDNWYTIILPNDFAKGDAS
jgi:hypothetical protein